VFTLLRLPSGSSLAMNDIAKLPPPYAHGQTLIRLRLDNGIVLEAVWDDYRHHFSVTAYEVHADETRKAVCERSTPNREWVPGVVNTLAWELAFTKVETCGAGPAG
jgi:hypothetical protein